MQQPRLSLGKFLALFTILVAPSLLGAQNQEPAKPIDPSELVRTVIQNELKSNSDNGRYLSWKQKQVKPSRTTLKLYVDTPEGLLGRLLSIDGHPLTPQETAKEDARINRLLDPSQMRQKRKQQKEDENRTRKMVGALPDAFIYTIVGTEETKDGHTLVNLRFTPNPKFDPPSRETLVFQGMAGDMVVDETEMRLVKIDGTMTRDVSIGWGIIGHLDKGGRFEVQQTEVEKGDWEVTFMRLNFTGKALIFKTIRINEIDTSFDFKPVPKMTVAQAIGFLKKAESKSGEVAEK